jgi:hypothetical protein
MKNKILIVLILVLGIILSMIGPKYCSGGQSKSDTFLKITHDTTWDTTNITSPIYIPGKIIYIPGPTITEHVDTAKILADYFAKLIYFDTIRMDSLGYIAIRDTITKNKLAARQHTKNYRIPKVTTTIEKTINHYEVAQRKLYGGFLVDITNIGGYGTLSYENKKNTVFHFGVGANSTSGMGFLGGISWKISK